MFGVVTSGWGKTSATTRPSVSLPKRLFVSDCKCVLACVCVCRRRQTLILLPALMCVRVCLCVNKCARPRQYVCFLHHKAPVPLIIHIELLKTCHVLIIKHVSSTKCSFEEHPKNSSGEEDYKMCGSLLGNKHD